MTTELEMIQGARIQYRAYFRTMALGGRWHIYRAESGETVSGVILAPECDMNGKKPMVCDVHAMAEQTMVNALSNAVRMGA